MKKRPDKGLAAAIEKAGSISQLAKGLKLTQGAVSQWDRVPIRQVIAVSRLTGIPAGDIRPDVFDAPELRQRKRRDTPQVVRP